MLGFMYVLGIVTGVVLAYEVSCLKAWIHRITSPRVRRSRRSGRRAR